MLLLVTDTSGKHGSVALARAHEADGCETVEVIEVVPLAGGTFSAQLVPQIAGVLDKHGFTKRDLDGFVVISGPGSFTGLRVGLAAIKGLAEILHKPIAAVSTLEVLALSASKHGPVLAVLDAGRGELYAGEYEISDTGARLIQEQVIRKEELATFVGCKSVSVVDPSLARAARDSGLSVFELQAVKPETIAAQGYRQLQAGETVLPELLDANYVRRSDADVFGKPTHG